MDTSALNTETLPEVQRLLQNMQLVLLVLIVIAVLAPFVLSGIKRMTGSKHREPLSIEQCRTILGCRAGSSEDEIEQRYQALKSALGSAKLKGAEVSDELRALTRQRLLQVEEAYQVLKRRN